MAAWCPFTCRAQYAGWEGQLLTGHRLAGREAVLQFKQQYPQYEVLAPGTGLANYTTYLQTLMDTKARLAAVPGSVGSL